MPPRYHRAIIPTQGSAHVYHQTRVDKSVIAEPGKSKSIAKHQKRLAVQMPRYECGVHSRSESKTNKGKGVDQQIIEPPKRDVKRREQQLAQNVEI